jgi:type I restriction enzyme S subunit
MIKYDTYKNSGIEWLGEIPEHWEVNRLKDEVVLLTGFPFKSSKYSDNGVKLVRGINVKEGVLNWKDTKHWNDFQPYLDKYYLEENDVLIQMDGSKVGKNFCMISSEDLPLLLLQRVARLRTKKNLNPKYLFYTLVSSNFLYWVTITKTDPLVPHIAPKDINNYVIPLQPYTEQTTIVNYLDNKTKAIDQKINLLTKKTEKYKELRKALINQTVTKGLDKNTIWKTFRLKNIGRIYSGLSGKSGDDFRKEKDPNNRGFVPFTNIANNTYLNVEHLGKVIISPTENQNKVQKNDLFFLMSSEGYEDIGKSAVLREDIPETYLNSFCKGFRITNTNVDAFFINYLLLSDDNRNKMVIQGKGFTRINLKIEKVNNFSITIPSTKAEQTAIANYLDEKTGKIDSIIINIKNQINNLTELRKTLINDVVTGKIKVVN